MTHPGRDDLQRATRGSRRRGRLPGFQAEVQLALTRREPLPCGGLQRLNLGLVVPRPEMLDLARPTPRRVHDLHRDRLHGADVGHERAAYGPG
jgi:hypothetical protein